MRSSRTLPIDFPLERVMFCNEIRVIALSPRSIYQWQSVPCRLFKTCTSRVLGLFSEYGANITPTKASSGFQKSRGHRYHREYAYLTSLEACMKEMGGLIHQEGVERLLNRLDAVEFVRGRKRVSSLGDHLLIRNRFKLVGKWRKIH